jgi:3-oxoacyl-[acyl-carrier-protein] synthase II
MADRRVVVTGLGTLNPLGNSVADYFHNLKEGMSGAGPITRFDAEKFKTRFACEVKNYNGADYFDRKEGRRYDLFTQFALVAAAQAMEDSGLEIEKVDPEKAGVIWASGIGGLKSLFEEVKTFVLGDGTPRLSPFFITMMIPDIAAG